MPYRETDNVQAKQTAVHSELEQEIKPPQKLGKGHNLLQLQNQYGNQYVQQLINPNQQITVQPKLMLGDVDTPSERQADRIATQVMGGRVSSIPTPVNGTVTPISPQIESSINQAKGGGQPLSEQTRSQMEQGLGTDLSGVRVHTDGRADSLNHSLQAKAFTTGSDLFFRRGAYDPGSSSGQQLLAHELTHVVQQGGDLLHQPNGQLIQRYIFGEIPKKEDEYNDKKLTKEKAQKVLAYKAGIKDKDFIGVFVEHYYDNPNRHITIAKINALYTGVRDQKEYVTGGERRTKGLHSLTESDSDFEYKSTAELVADYIESNKEEKKPDLEDAKSSFRSVIKANKTKKASNENLLEEKVKNEPQMVAAVKKLPKPKDDGTVDPVVLGVESALHIASAIALLTAGGLAAFTGVGALAGFALAVASVAHFVIGISKIGRAILMKFWNPDKKEVKSLILAEMVVLEGGAWAIAATVGAIINPIALLSLVGAFTKLVRAFVISHYGGKGIPPDPRIMWVLKTIENVTSFLSLGITKLLTGFGKLGWKIILGIFALCRNLAKLFRTEKGKVGREELFKGDRSLLASKPKAK